MGTAIVDAVAVILAPDPSPPRLAPWPIGPRTDGPQRLSTGEARRGRGARSATITARLLEIVRDRTGYPIETLGLDLDIEADLGIDSIKRVEILGKLRDEFPTLKGPADSSERWTPWPGPARSARSSTAWRRWPAADVRSTDPAIRSDRRFQTPERRSAPNPHPSAHLRTVESFESQSSIEAR